MRYLPALVIAVLALVAVAFLVVPSTGPYHYVAGDAQRVKLYPAIQYWDRGDGDATPRVTVEIKNADRSATYFVEYGEEVHDVEVDEGRTEKIRINLDSVDREQRRTRVDTVKVYRGSRDPANLVAEFPVFLVVEDAPQYRVHDGNATVAVGQMIIPTENRDGYFVVFVNVDDSKDVNSVEVEVTGEVNPIAVTSVDYTEQTLNSDKWLKVVVTYDVRDSAQAARVYPLHYRVTVNYADANQPVDLSAYFVYGGGLERLEEMYEDTFEEVSNVG